MINPVPDLLGTKWREVEGHDLGRDLVARQADQVSPRFTVDRFGNGLNFRRHHPNISDAGTT